MARSQSPHDEAESGDLPWTPLQGHHGLHHAWICSQVYTGICSHVQARYMYGDMLPCATSALSFNFACFIQVSCLALYTWIRLSQLVEHLPRTLCATFLNSSPMYMYSQSAYMYMYTCTYVGYQLQMCELYV